MDVIGNLLCQFFIKTLQIASFKISGDHALKLPNQGHGGPHAACIHLLKFKKKCSPHLANPAYSYDFTNMAHCFLFKEFLILRHCMH